MYNLNEAIDKQVFPKELVLERRGVSSRSLVTRRGDTESITDTGHTMYNIDPDVDAEHIIVSRTAADKALEKLGLPKNKTLFARYGFHPTPKLKYPDDPKDVVQLRFRCDCGKLVGREFYDPKRENDQCFCHDCGSWVTWRDDYPD